MDCFIQHVKDKLLDTFSTVEALSSMYVSRAGKDFKRQKQQWNIERFVSSQFYFVR